MLSVSSTEQVCVLSMCSHSPSFSETSWRVGVLGTRPEYQAGRGLCWYPGDPQVWDACGMSGVCECSVCAANTELDQPTSRQPVGWERRLGCGWGTGQAEVPCWYSGNPQLCIYLQTSTGPCVHSTSDLLPLTAQEEVGNLGGGLCLCFCESSM